MDVGTLLAAMPGLARTTAENYLPLMEAAMREFGITGELRARMWLAQVGHESVSLRYLEEIASGAAYEGRGDLGNVQPGDGRRFKGRGPIQITGRRNYAAAGLALGIDLVGHPELAAQPQYAFRVSAWWWKTHGLNEISDAGDVVTATRRINGGLNGLADRQSRYTRCTRLGAAVIPADSAGTEPAPAQAPVEVPPQGADSSGPTYQQDADVLVWTPPPVQIDIQQVTLHGYAPGQRDYFAGELRARLTARGVPDEAARQAAEAILDTADARLGGTSA
jgi:predicted chitinase